MITTEIRINGIMIGHVYCTNKGEIQNMPGRYLYAYEYYRPDEGKIIKGEVFHKREDKAERLLQIILTSVIEKLQIDEKSC